jgi:serine/threonine-protein kinase RsbW
MNKNVDLTKTIQFPSDVEYLEKIEKTSAKIAADAGFDESTVDDISIALTELVNNAIHHGNQNDRNKIVTVSFTVDEKKISISISDQGHGFSPASISDPVHPDNLMADNGRGIYLVKALMDNVDYKISDAGTEVIIIKNK